MTSQQRYNLSSPAVNFATSGGILVHGYNGVPTPPQPYKAEDIVIVSCFAPAYHGRFANLPPVD